MLIRKILNQKISFYISFKVGMIIKGIHGLFEIIKSILNITIKEWRKRMEIYLDYKYTGKTQKDLEAIEEAIDKDIDLFIDEDGKVLTSDGKFIANAKDKEYSGSGGCC